MAPVVRLVTLLAVLLLPFATAIAPAAPVEQQHHATTMASHHGPEVPSDKSAATVGHDCAMPCAAALPAEDLAPTFPEQVWRTAIAAPAQSSLSGIDLEIATPPPKRA